MSQQSSLLDTPKHFWRVHQDPQRPTGEHQGSKPLGVRKSEIVMDSLRVYNFEVIQIPRAYFSQSILWRSLTPVPQKEIILKMA